jgi:hypothetical protein
MGMPARAPKPISNICSNEHCKNPKNGSLVPTDYGINGYIYADGTRAHYRKCKHCYAKAGAQRYALTVEVEDKPLKTDWNEFSRLAWDVRAANNYIRGML